MIEEFANYVNIDLKILMFAIALTIGATNALKKFGKLEGFVNLIPVGICAIIMGFVFGLPDGVEIMAYMLGIGIGSILSWETVKCIAHKMAEPPQPKKPEG